MIESNSLEALKAQIDIVDVIENYVELKKAGANYKANCPFHDEKSGSFVVSPQKQICKCFGCGFSSDAIGFVQQYKNLSFVESVEEIAKDMNYSLTYSKNTTNHKDYSSLMESVAKLYLSKKSKAYEYLKQRGLTDESMTNFEIGFAPSSKEQVDFVSSQLFNTDEAIECGILARDNDKTYARLTNRIVFPIRNHTNKLIGFGGRVLENDNRAKYLNSPTTKLFDKSRSFYGYNLAKAYIHKKGTITITEGYLDVVMLHQAGIKTAVATMGTALTEQHTQLIKKAKVRALLCFDGDKAGAGAGFKASVLLAQHGIDGGVVLFPTGKDPADMIKDNKIEELISIMKKPLPIVKYIIDFISQKYNLSIPVQKQEALNEAQAFLNSLSPLMRDEYRKYVAYKLEIAEEHIQHQQIATPQMYQAQNINIAELSIIKTARESDGFLNQVLDVIDSSMFVYHRVEFEMVCKDDSQIDGLLLREDIKVYNEDELKEQLDIFLLEAYNNEILMTLSELNVDVESRYQKILTLKSKISLLQER